MALINDELRYRLKYVGAEPLEKVGYLRITDGTNDLTFFNEELAEIENKTFIASTGTIDIKIVSLPLFMPVIVSNVTANPAVSGHLSTWEKNYANEGFSFGTYFPECINFNIELNGCFYIKDANGNATFNGLCKGMKNIVQHNVHMFDEYIYGRAGNNNTTQKYIVGLNETFMDNTALTTLELGQFRTLSQVLTCIRTYKGCPNIVEVPRGYWSVQQSVTDWTDVFDPGIPGS